MIKKIMLLLKKGMRLISLWFIISFLSENHSWTIWTLIYVMTLGCLLSLVNCLEKLIYKGWFGASTMIFSSSNIKLGIVWIMDQEGSWMKIMSKFVLFSKIMSVRSPFFQTFCEKVFYNHILTLSTTKWIDLPLFL